MPTIAINIANTIYTFNTSASQDAGLHLAWDKVMNQLPVGESQDANTAISDRPGYVNSASKYLENIIVSWLTSNPSGNVQAMMEQCITSWDTSPSANTTPPEIVLSDETKLAMLIAYVADKRWRVETGGTTIGGISMPTDRDTQAKLAAAFLLSQADPTTVFSWKVENGFVEISASQMMQIAVAIGKFVQSAYKAEQDVITAINNDAIKTQEDVDAFPWPT